MYYVLGDYGGGAGREAVSFIEKEYSFLSRNNDWSLTEELFSWQPQPLFSQATFLRDWRNNYEILISWFSDRRGSCLKYSSYRKSTAFLLHGTTMASSFVSKVFVDAPSLSLNVFLFGSNSLNSNNETFLKAYETFMLLKSALTLSLSFSF